MRKKTLLLILLVALAACKSSKMDPLTLASSETASEYLSYLASDELKGRDSGSPGIEKAAQYIEGRFEQSGVRPYFQSFRDPFKIDDIDAFNVVGMVPGNDETLKDEFILIGAHYDHVGTRAKKVGNDSIANGANDNAAGTVAVMMLAEYFAQRKSNGRSLMFALFSGEERGLKGSQHLATKLKAEDFDLYTMLNFEMVGVPFSDRDYDVFASGYDLSNLAEKVNEYAGSKVIGRSEVSVKYNLFKRSDNYPFYEEFKLPCQTISSCDLSNYDFYHHVDDETEKMDFEHLANVVNKLIPAIETMSNTTEREIVLHEN